MFHPISHMLSTKQISQPSLFPIQVFVYASTHMSILVTLIDRVVKRKNLREYFIYRQAVAGCLYVHHHIGISPAVTSTNIRNNFIVHFHRFETAHWNDGVVVIVPVCPA